MTRSPAYLPASAVYAYFFLLNYGYTEKQASAVVRARYGLDERAVRVLKRCVHPADVSAAVRRRSVGLGEVDALCVDGFNQALTLYALRTLRYAYHCTDGLLRDDLSGSALRDMGAVADAIRALVRVARRAGVSRVVVVLDASVPRSGQLASSIRGLGVETLVARKADTTLVELSRECVVATSDILVLRAAPAHTDLARAAADATVPAYAVVDLEEALRQAHRAWCESVIASGAARSQREGP